MLYWYGLAGGIGLGLISGTLLWCAKHRSWGNKKGTAISLISGVTLIAVASIPSFLGENFLKATSYMGNFEAENAEDLVIKQIKHNCAFWSSDKCKRSTVEKYCKAKGVEDPAQIINKLIKAGVLYEPKKDYIALTQ